MTRAGAAWQWSDLTGCSSASRPGASRALIDLGDHGSVRAPVPIRVRSDRGETRGSPRSCRGPGAAQARGNCLHTKGNKPITHGLQNPLLGFDSRRRLRAETRERPAIACASRRALGRQHGSPVRVSSASVGGTLGGFRSGTPPVVGVFPYQFCNENHRDDRCCANGVDPVGQPNQNDQS